MRRLLPRSPRVGRSVRLVAVCGALLALAALLTDADPLQAQSASPTVALVAVSSVPGTAEGYALGETIRVTLSFSEPVDVTGSPRLAIDMDPADWGTKWAGYESGSGTSNISFAHTVVEPNFSSQGIAVLADTLEVNGGTIRSASSQVDADLSHEGKGHDPSHQVDWQLSPAAPNRAPVVNTESQNHKWFVREQHAPRGVLVSKSFAGLFSDPDGDQLIYAASVTGGRAELLDDLAIGSWGRSDLLAAQSLRSREVTQRVFIEVDDEDDWDALEPALGENPVISVTVTATDPSGLTASVEGDFVVPWAPRAALTQLNLDEDPANSIGPQGSASDQAAGPTVSDVDVTSDAGSDDIYALGDTIQVSLTFSEAVVVTGAPQLKIDMDPADWGTKLVPYDSGSGTDTLTFAHVVVEPNYSTQGIAVLANSLALNGGTIKSMASELDADLVHVRVDHDGEHRVDWQYVAQQPPSPTVTEVSVSSDAGSDRSYAKGEVVRVSLRLSEAVTVTGTPRIKLDFRVGDGDEQWANLESGSGSTSLVFAYTLAAGDDSQRGVAVVANSLDLNGGTIVSTSDSTNNALLTHSGLVRDLNHRVDCTPPTLLTAVAEGTTLTLTFDEELGAAASLSNSQFSIVRTPQGGTEESIGLSGTPVISSVSVTLTLASAVLETDTDVEVSYTKPTTGANNRLIDIAGNEVESFSGVSATKDTTPPRLVSGQLDGDRLIFYFSEALDETSFGGWFRATIRYPGGIRNSSTMSGPVEIKGNKVTVGLGLGRVALAGVTNNHAFYIKDESPGAKVLRDLAGNEVELRPGTDHTRIITLENITVGPPRVTRVEFSTNPGADATYGLGDTISVRLTFDQPVLVIGEPRLKIAYDTGIGARLGDERWATYSGHSGTSALVFSYTVAEAENSLNISTRGVAVVGNSLTGGTIRSVESSKHADRTHGGLGHHANHRVNIPLQLKSAELSGTTLTIHFNKPLGEASSLSNSAFVVKKTTAGGTVQTVGLSGAPLISGHTLTLQLSNAPSSTDTGVSVSYNKPGSGSGNRLVDTAGVELASFSDQSVGADVTPPTLIRAEVDGHMLTLVFNEPLDENYNQGQRFRVRLNSRPYFHIEFPIHGDVQISGHRVTASTAFRSQRFSAKAGLNGDNRAYYYVQNIDTGTGLRDLAGNVVSVPHQNHGFWTTRWVRLENLTR